MKFRWLNDDEYVKEGDYGYSSAQAQIKDPNDPHLQEAERSLRANKSNEMWQAGRWGSAGKPQRFWRRVIETDWISVKDKLPTHTDDKFIAGVLAITDRGRLIVWEEFVNTPIADDSITHWRTIYHPHPPVPEVPNIKITEAWSGQTHTVSFDNNGDISVGCTKIKSDVFAEIVKRREAKMKE